MAKVNDLTGKQFGTLTVLHIANNRGIRYWHCVCGCGTEKVIRGNHLTSGNTLSCGCKKKFEDLTGKTFGRLTVISYHDKTKSRRWFCKCECGNTIVVPIQSLKNGNTSSCGCLRKDRTIEASTRHGLRKRGLYNPAYEKYKRKDPKYRLRKNCSCTIWKALTNSNNKKNNTSILKYLPYTIDQLKNHLESLWEDWMSWENYGGRANDKRKTWHIDHIVPHSSFQYTNMNDEQFIKCWSLDNLRPLEKTANYRKGIEMEDLNVEDVLGNLNKKRAAKRKNSGRKGKTGERNLCKILSERFNKPFSRVVGSGNRIRQTQLTEEAKELYTGDVVVPPGFKFCIESKHGYPEVDFCKALDGGQNTIDEFMKQAERDANSIGKMPLLCYKKNRMPWVAFVLLNSFGPVLVYEHLFYYKKWVGVSLTELLKEPDSFFFTEAACTSQQS